MAQNSTNPNRLQSYPLKSVVSVLLVAILGLSPALSLLHLAFDSHHHHHYCTLHGQIEESDRKETASEHITGNTLDQTGGEDFAVSNSSESAPRHHEVCALVNDGTPRFRLTTNSCQSAIVDRDNGKFVGNASDPMDSRCQLFLLAPKHSPPANHRAYS